MAEKQPVSPVEAEYASIEKQYERRVWWTKIVPVMRNVGLVVWSVTDIVLVFGSLIFFGWYLVQGAFDERQLLARLQQNQSAVRLVASENRAEGLIVSDAQVLSGVEGRFDLYATVNNSNEQWIARFDYYFETSAGSTAVRKGYALPGRERHLVELSQESEQGRPGRATIVVESIEWERVKGLPDGNIEEWLEVHEDIVVSELTHGSVAEIGDRDVVQTSFTLTNNTPYSYWDVDLVILLRVGRTVIGVNQVRLPYLDSGEVLDRAVNWFWSPSLGANPEVVPQIDFFDESIYKENIGKPTGELIERL